MNRREMDRRTFVSAAIAVAGGGRFSHLVSEGSPSGTFPEIDAFIQERMTRYNIAGTMIQHVKLDLAKMEDVDEEDIEEITRGRTATSGFQRCTRAQGSE